MEIDWNSLEIHFVTVFVPVYQHSTGCVNNSDLLLGWYVINDYWF